MAKLGYQNSETHEPTVTKFGVGNYVGDITPRVHAKTQSDRPVGVSEQMGEILLSRGFYIHLYSPYFVT